MASDIKTKHLGDAYRQKIQTSMLINRLQTNAESEQEIMTSGQILSAKILLGKALPDLTSVAGTMEHSVDTGTVTALMELINARKNRGIPG